MSRSYILLWRSGMITRRFPDLAMMRRIVREGNVCIDLGANLGYYTAEMARRVGPAGRVLAVEPVPIFGRILRSNVADAPNVEVMPFALGAEEGRLKLSTPIVDGVFRHGLTRVVGAEEQPVGETYEVDMRRPDSLFAGLDRLDYVKCDVEGYEGIVFSNMRATLERHTPVVQVEITGDENRRIVFEVMTALGYSAYTAAGSSLRRIEDQTSAGDFFFLADHHRDILNQLSG